MTQNITKSYSSGMSLRNASLIGGIALLLIAILAPVGHYGIIQELIVEGDAAATVARISESQSLFRAGIGCLLVNAILDLVAAWALFIVLKATNKSIALLSAWFRIVYSAILIVALSNFVHVAHILNGPEYLSAIAPDLLSARVMLLLDSYNNVWTLGFVVFGLHLATLGYVLFRSAHFPAFLGVLVTIAGLGYVVDHMGEILLPSYDLNISIYTFVGELFLMVWLLLRGFRGFSNS